ncbi:MAG TPA: hypothetical protein VEL75_17145, partial [Candidatus Methylomirabilis sp.]|nr:hypothetical protein [Candidatus Methylomirabilis sp.]
MAALRRLACLLVDEPAPERAGDLLEVALAHSPRVEEGGPGLVYLDVAGLRRLLGEETEIARRLARAATERGLRARVGIAGSRIAALVAARRGGGVVVVKPGEDAAYLASAPIAFLDLEDAMQTRLGHWGIRTLGELAALPAKALFERLGSGGLRLRQLARGEDGRPLRSWAPLLVFEESVEPGWSMETLEPLGDLLTALAGRICAQLSRRGLAADRFEWACR